MSEKKQINPVLSQVSLIYSTTTCNETLITKTISHTLKEISTKSAPAENALVYTATEDRNKFICGFEISNSQEVLYYEVITHLYGIQS